MEMKKIGVIGGGNFGTAISQLLLLNDVIRELIIIEKSYKRVLELKEILKEYKNERQRINIVELNNNKKEEVKNVLKETEIIFLSIPSSSIPFFIKNFKEVLNHKTLVNLSKGLISNQTIYSFIKTNLKCNFISLKGPTFADELINEKRGSFTILTNENIEGNISLIKNLFKNTKILFDFSCLVEEGELVSCLKNIYAILFGFLFGNIIDQHVNFKSSLFSLVIKEIRTILEDLKLNTEILNTFCGLGDLIGSCLFNKSRNYLFGVNINTKSENIKNMLCEGKENLSNVKSFLSYYNLSLKDYTFLSLVFKIVEGKIDIKVIEEEILKKELFK